MDDGTDDVVDFVTFYCAPGPLVVETSKRGVTGISPESMVHHMTAQGSR